MKPRLETLYYVQFQFPGDRWISEHQNGSRREAFARLRSRRKLHAGLKPHQRAMWRLIRVSTIVSVIDPKP